ncbi:hypothetical protein OEZ86_004473 [Tetradesmus obliquus]|nr:hypothetical protein OEZ86_004473 [Tetradesmus obliquus]
MDAEADGSSAGGESVRPAQLVLPTILTKCCPMMLPLGGLQHMLQQVQEEEPPPGACEALYTRVSSKQLPVVAL